MSPLLSRCVTDVFRFLRWNLLNVDLLHLCSLRSLSHLPPYNLLLPACTSPTDGAPLVHPSLCRRRMRRGNRPLLVRKRSGLGPAVRSAALGLATFHSCHGHMTVLAVTVGATVTLVCFCAHMCELWSLAGFTHNASLSEVLVVCTFESLLSV